MAGSIKWIIYEDDFGDNWAILADESNVEAISTTSDYTGTPALTNSLPRNVKPRYAVYGTTDGTRSLKVVVPTPAIYATLATDTPTIDDPITSGLTLVLQRIRPEVRRLPIPNDTGIQDGDIT